MALKRKDNLNKAKLLTEIERLKKELKKRKKYGLVWEEKPEEVVEMCKEKLPILKEVKSKEIMTDPDKPVNLLIEGDNYHVLSVLNYTHEKKIDVIYIDPPYNTGAKDWKYNNDYVDINDAYRHSKWLSMMSNRLKIAKNLLKNDGVLICAIDENECNRLGIMLEGIFKDHEIHCITIVHNPRGVQGNNFSYTHEYAYFVFRNGLKVIGTKQREEVLEEELRDHGGESLRTDARNCFYTILVKNNQIIGFGEVPDKNYHSKSKNVKTKNGVIEVWPIDSKGVERKWVFAFQTVNEIKDKLFVKEKKNGEIDIFRRKDTQKPRTVWAGQRYDASTFGSKIVNGLTGTTSPFPKSIYNTKDCLECVIRDRKNAIVLDYFAGSGTTAHAVMILNKEDGGKRQFILYTNNENGIAEDVNGDEIIQIVLIDKNIRHFLNTIDMIKEVYKQETIKKESELSFVENWSVPESISYGSDDIKEDRKKSIMEPFYSKGKWKPEKTFIEFLENPSNSVEWWFKNGDRDATFFAVPYSNGEQKPFYVDFIVKLKDGRIGLFDTKAGFTQRLAGPKIDGLYRYIQGKNKRGKKLFGGIVANTDQRNYRGRWFILTNKAMC